MSQIEKQLEDDLDWRMKELKVLKEQASLASQSSDISQAFLRALWTMLYAHYEGFCKFAWDIYLDELQKAKIKRKYCQDNIAKLSLQQQFRWVKKDLSLDALWQLANQDFQEWLEENLEFAIKLETYNKLYPSIFKENVNHAGLHCDSIEVYKIEIKTLVARRNQIAHGQKMVIKNIDKYQKYEDAAIEVMYDLALAIVDCLDKKLYLKSP